MTHLTHGTSQHRTLIGLVARRPGGEVESDIAPQVLRIGNEATGGTKYTLSQRWLLKVGAAGLQPVADGPLGERYVGESKRRGIHLQFGEYPAAHILIVRNSRSHGNDTAEKG